MNLDIKIFKPRRNSANTLNARGEEFINFKSLTSTQATYGEYRKAINRFQRWVTAESVKEITPQTIYRYFIYRSKLGKGRIAAGQDRTLLCAFFAWCVRMGYMASNPVEALPGSAFPKSTARHKTFSPFEYERLKAVSSGLEWYYAIVCSWHTGLRLSDVCLLKWSSVDLEKCVIHLVPKKTQRTGKTATIPVHPELAELLAARSLLKIGDEQHVTEELAILYQRDRSATLTKQFRKLLQKAGIAGRTFHSLRHTALERWMNHPNADVITVMDMSGHSNPKMLSRYCQPSIEKKKMIMGLDTHGEIKQISNPP